MTKKKELSIHQSIQIAVERGESYGGGMIREDFMEVVAGLYCLMARRVTGTPVLRTGQHAKVRAIKHRLSDVFKDAKDGATYVVTFSGHGWRQEPAEGPEPGQFAFHEAWNLWDGLYWDVWLQEVLDSIQRKCLVIVLSDCCHAEGMFPRVEEQPVGPPLQCTAKMIAACPESAGTAGLRLTEALLHAFGMNPDSWAKLQKLVARYCEKKGWPIPLLLDAEELTKDQETQRFGFKQLFKANSVLPAPPGERKEVFRVYALGMAEVQTYEPGQGPTLEQVEAELNRLFESEDEKALRQLKERVERLVESVEQGLQPEISFWEIRQVHAYLRGAIDSLAPAASPRTSLNERDAPGAGKTSFSVDPDDQIADRRVIAGVAIAGAISAWTQVDAATLIDIIRLAEEACGAEGRRGVVATADEYLERALSRR